MNIKVPISKIINMFIERKLNKMENIHFVIINYVKPLAQNYFIFVYYSFISLHFE